MKSWLLGSKGAGFCAAAGLLLWLVGWKLRKGLRVLFTNGCHPALGS